MASAVPAASVSDARRRRARAMPGTVRDRLLLPLLKIGLPLAAMALLAALVLLPLAGSRELSFVLAKDKVGMAHERMRLAGAVYRGETSDGQAFTIAADNAVQQTSETPIVELTRLAANIALTDGPASFTAPSGLYNMSRDVLALAGPVRLLSGAGYTLNSNLVRIDLKARTVSTDRPVSGTLPIGTFRANSMRADIRGRTVVLDGAAHLRITPGRRISPR